MALQSSGPISMSDIRTEFDVYGYYTGILFRCVIVIEGPGLYRTIVVQQLSL